MNKIEIEIQLDPVNDGVNFMSGKTIDGKKQGLVVGTNGTYRIIGEEEVLKILDQLDMVSETDCIGKTSFLAVFNRQKILTTGNTKFLVGSVLIVKDGKNGIELLDIDETEKARAEFESRLTILCSNGIQFLAYEIG